MKVSFGICSLLFSSYLCQAQFVGLATTGDGAELYFSSGLRMRNTQQYLHPKIFALAPDGPRLVAQVERIGVGFTNSYLLTEPAVSADGKVVSWTATRVCQGGSSCFLNEQSSATIRTQAGERSAGGHVRLSRNGRYAVAYNSANSMLWRTALIDLAGGADVNLNLRPRIPPAVGSEGSVLLYDGALLLVKDGNTRTLTTDVISAVAMDDGATTAVYQTPSRRLQVVDIRSGASWPLGPGDRDSFQPSLSADGSRVLYLSQIGERAQAFISRPDGSDWRQLTDDTDGIREAVLSGDGGVAWVLSEAGAIRSIGTRNGEIRERVASGPFVREVTGGHAPGSTNIIEGARLDLAERQVTLDGRGSPVQFASSERMVFQVPWDQPVPDNGEKDVVLAFPGGDAAFEPAFSYTVRRFDPQVVALAESDSSGWVPTVVHQDFSAMVTSANPARPGEIVHLFLTGLGPVSPEIETGRAAPLDSLSRVTTPWRFRLSATEGYLDADVLFAGLAPGLIGYYQMDVRLPQSNSTFLYLEVRFEVAPGQEYVWGLTGIPFGG